MIRNFEEYTHNMTMAEKKYILPQIIRILSLAIGKEKAITNNQIIENIILPSINEYPESLNLNMSRIRHIIHVLRVSDMIPFLVASSKGYYISNNKDEIETYIKSIDDRLKSIYQIRKALRRQTKNFPNKQTDSQQRLIL